MGNRIFHCFRWTLKDIKNNVEKISKQGFNFILTTSVQPHKKINKNYCDKEWWKYYQNFDFSIGNDLGSKDDLIDLACECKKYGVRLMVDVVANHVAGDDYGNLVPHPEVAERLKNDWFYKEPVNIKNFEDEYDVTHHCIGLPGLNLQNYDLANIIVDFINELISCGVTAIRWDAFRHIGLPRNGIDFAKRIIKPLGEKGIYNIGEILDGSYDFIEEASKYCDILTEKSNHNHNKIVVFSENHDTFLNTNEVGRTRNIDEEIVIRDYIELTRFYPNTLFYPRPFSEKWKEPRIREANII